MSSQTTAGPFGGSHLGAVELLGRLDHKPLTLNPKKGHGFREYQLLDFTSLPCIEAAPWLLGGGRSRQLPADLTGLGLRKLRV